MIHHPIMSVEAANITADTQAVTCPGCNAQLMIRRSAAPPIDACGFESYRLACGECGASLACIIDPADDTPFISELSR